MNTIASWSLCDADGVPKESIRKFLDDYYISFVHMNPFVSGSKLIYSDCMEPDFMCDSEQDIIDRSSEIHHIFTRRKRILSECPNSSLMVFGTSWVSEGVEHRKRSTISFTTTSKRGTEFEGENNDVDGYSLRHEVVNNLSSLKQESCLPLEYWGSSRLPLRPDLADYMLGDTKDFMFESMFNVSIENQRCDNFFTEKLIDCFKTKTVPIYFGTSDIGDYFDTRGMVIIDGIDDLYGAVRDLNEDKYFSMMTYINENWERCQQYSADFCDRISEELDRLS